MLDHKSVISAVGIILGFTGYAFYIKDILRGTTKPHLFSWFIWFALEAITFGIQIANGGGVGSYITAISALGALAVLSLGFKKGDKTFPFIDWFFLGCSIISLALWLVAKEPIAAIVLIAITDALAFTPTFRKTFSRPYDETLIEYTLAAIKYSLALLALREYHLTTYLFPLYVTMANATFVVYALIRRKQIRSVERI